MIMLASVAAMGSDRTIGKDGELPWSLPDDLARFKALTLDKPLIMGRKTFESIGRPLPRRTNIVLTRDVDYSAPGCVVVHSVEDALEACGQAPEGSVAGGEQIYRLFLPLLQRQYLTLIHADFGGDARYPEYDESRWREVEREEHPADDRHAHAFTFLTLERLQS